MTMITRKIDLPNNTRSRASINLEQSEMVMQLNIVHSICKIFWSVYYYAISNLNATQVSVPSELFLFCVIFYKTKEHIIKKVPSARWIAETNSSISVKTSFFSSDSPISGF